MKTSKKDILSFCKQLISSVLSVTLLINLATPLAAQSVASDTGTKQVEMQQRFTKALEREVLQAARESTLTDSGTLAKRYFSDPDIRRLEELELAFNHPTLDPNSETKDMKADFVNQYNRVIEEEIITARQKVKQYERALRKQKEALRKEAIEAKVSDAVLNAWDKEAESKIQENIATLQTKITAWAVQARAEADSQYEAMLKEAQNESQKILRADLEELFALYKRVPYKALPYLINISITILLADGRNTSLLTQAEKDELLKLYIKEVQENTSCYKGKETWGRPCQGALNAVTGLGILGDANDARYISEFIDKVMTSPAAARGLLVGVSALLAMKQYKAVRRLLQTATQQESDTSHVDILSVKNLVDNIAATKGKYLGEVSKWAQFPAPGVGNTTDMSSSNAWEEIAYMLGDEGSAESLAILRDYGINKCSGYENKTLKGNTEYKIACGGIKPFLVGALVSGKSGQFTGPQVISAPGYVLDSNGRSSRYVDEQQVKKNIAYQQNIVNAVNAGAVALGVSVPAYIARDMYINKMGDLDADTQLALDTKLFEFFNKQTKGQANLKPGVRLTAYDKNSEQYKERQRRQHRVQVWKIIGTAADVGFLVWCVADLFRLGRKAVTLGRSIYTAAQMARAGEPVLARLTVLRKGGALRALKKVRQTWPAKIKSSVNASARPLLSQFTTVEEFFPHIPGVEEVALPTVRSGPQDITKVIEQLVTGRTDLLAINESAVTAQLGSSAEVTSRVATLQNHLNTAVKNADAAFANQRGFLKHAFGDSDIAYRIELSKEVKQIGQYYKDDARGAVVDLAARIKGDYTIHVPKDLRQLREVPLFDNAGKINGQTLKVLIKTVEGVPEAQAQGELMQALNTAKNQTNLAYTHRGWLRRSWTGITGRNKTAYNKILSDNILGLMEDKNLMTSFNQAEKDKVLRTLAAAVRDTKVSLPSDLGKYAAMKYDPVNLSYRTFQSSVFSPAKTPEMLPMSFNIDKGVRGVNRYGHYQRVVFSPQSKAKGYAMGLTDGFKTTNLSNFKIDIPSSQLPTLIRGAADAKLVKPLEIKMTPYSNKRAFRKAAKLSGGASPVMENASGRTFWQQLSSGFRGKTKIWTDEVPVYIRSGKEETLVPMVFKTDTQLGLAGSRFVLDNNNNMHLLQGGQDLFGKHRLRFSLPKKQITPLVDLSRSGVLSTPLSLMVRSGRNKLAPLFWTSGLSLSAASSGLITPLETTYKDQISEQQKTFITFVFPYLPSILSPAISPFIMKYGAANVLKASLMTVAGGLAFSTLMGFRGHLDEANPPSPWPLFITAGAIGFSSAMSRSTLNVLINSMGGGGSLLKSMAFKNAGSVFLLAPSFVYGWYRLRAQPAITGKTLTEEELSKPASDFSLAFPVLLTLSLAALSWVSAARLDSSIGRASAVLRGEKFNVFGKEMGVAWRTTFAPEVLPLAAATFAFTGFESAAFSKGTNLSLKPMYEATGLLDHSKPGNRANTLALVTGISAAAVPFATRMLAKPALTALGNPLKPGIEYKRMLGLSYAFNAAGGTLLMSYGLNPTPFKTEEGKFHVDPRMVSGIVLMGLGTANVTQSFQKLANIRIGKGSTIAKLTAGMDKASAASRAKELETMTMTSFSWSQLGIAALPALQGMYVDREKAMGIRPANGPLGSLWIPMAALGASIGLALYGMYPTRLPAGLVGGTKVVVDGLQSLNPRPYQHQMAEIYRDNRAGKLDLRIMQYRIDEQKKMEAAEEKARAAAKQEVVEPEEVKEEAAEK